VVKAMASAKQGYPIVSRVLGNVAPASSDTDAQFFGKLDALLRATVERVGRLTPTIVEVDRAAPGGRARFAPGQFYRLQNYEAWPHACGHQLVDGGLALTGAWVDREQGWSRPSCSRWAVVGSLRSLQAGRAGRPDGPDGRPTEIEPGETVVLVGGGLGNAVLFSIGQAFRKRGSRVLYFAGYKKMIDRYKVDDIEAAADVVVWCCDEAPGFAPARPQDRRSSATSCRPWPRTQAAPGRAADTVCRLRPHHRHRLGQDDGGRGARAARHPAPHLKATHRAIGSINSPMQCMMKEICAQCLQPHRDPVTGKVTYVFSCFNQDQALDEVDFAALDVRLRQNSVQEKLTAQWIPTRSTSEHAQTALSRNAEARRRARSAHAQVRERGEWPWSTSGSSVTSWSTTCTTSRCSRTALVVRARSYASFPALSRRGRRPARR
jgi:hypothetical protein